MAEEVLDEATVKDDGGVVAIDDAVASCRMAVEAENAERTRSYACIKSDIFSKADRVKRHQTYSKGMCTSMLSAPVQAVAVAEQESERVLTTTRACVGGLGPPESRCC